MSNRVQKWNVGPEHRKERETFCGCFGKRTPFLRLRAQLQQDVSKGLSLCFSELKYTEFEPNSPSSTTQDASNLIQKNKLTQKGKNKMNIKKLFVAAAAALTLAACGAAQTSNSSSSASSEAKQENKHVKIGVNAGNHEVWDDVIARLKEKEGIEVELVEFTDYVQPNQALENGDVDLNSFQTIIYLERFNKEQGTHIKPIGYTVIAPMGVYSKKIKNVSELKDGDTIAIPEDTSNNSRALRLLHAAGVIKLKDPNNTLATKDDIVENPKNIQIKELPAGQTARALDDVAASLINNGFAVEAGFQPTKDSIFIEQITDSSQPYYNVIAAKEGNENNEVYKKIVEYYQSPETAKKIEEVSKGANVPVWEKAKLK